MPQLYLLKKHHAANVVHLRCYAISRSHDDDDDDDVKIRRLFRVLFVKMNALLRKVYTMIKGILFLRP